jgi:hypothetical protein
LPHRDRSILATLNTIPVSQPLVKPGFLFVPIELTYTFNKKTWTFLHCYVWDPATKKINECEAAMQNQEQPQK